MSSKSIVLLIALILAYPVYRFGMWTVNDSSVAASTTGVRIIHFDILSTRIGGCYLMVRDSHTNKIGEIEPLDGYHCPKFEDGDHVDMEVWDKSGGYPDYVFKGDNVNPEETYHEVGYKGNLQ